MIRVHDQFGSSNKVQERKSEFLHTKYFSISILKLLCCFNMRLILYLGNVSSVVNEIYFIAYSFNINFIFYSIFCTKLQTVGNKCFAKCVTKPGTSLSGGESSCVSRCVDRYIEATGIISRALFSSPR